MSRSPPAARRASETRALRPGHQLALLKGGAALFDALVQAIDAARAEVMLETYIFEFVGAPIRVAAALERAAARGVTVRVVVDGIGTDDIPDEWCKRWQAAGVQWRVFNPARGWRVLLPARWRRLHRKLCVVDATVCFCGGINLLDDYFDPTYGKLEQPRFDFAVRATGPLVEDAHETMTRLWLRMQAVREARHVDLKAALAAVRMAARAGTDADEAAKALASSPASCCATTCASAGGSSTSTATRSASRRVRSSSPTPISFPEWRCSARCCARRRAAST
jgi:cardiolipin synthase